MKTKKILDNSGGPVRESFGKENVIPVYFNVEDPFCSLSDKFSAIEELANRGQLTEIFMAYSQTDESGTKHFVRAEWLGKEKLTSILGTIEYAKEILKRAHIDIPIRHE